jgi:hypothetical protein
MPSCRLAFSTPTPRVTSCESYKRNPVGIVPKTGALISALDGGCGFLEKASKSEKRGTTLRPPLDSPLSQCKGDLSHRITAHSETISYPCLNLDRS